MKAASLFRAVMLVPLIAMITPMAPADNSYWLHRKMREEEEQSRIENQRREAEHNRRLEEAKMQLFNMEKEQGGTDLSNVPEMKRKIKKPRSDNKNKTKKNTRQQHAPAGFDYPCVDEHGKRYYGMFGTPECDIDQIFRMYEPEK